MVADGRVNLAEESRREDVVSMLKACITCLGGPDVVTRSDLAGACRAVSGVASSFRQELHAWAEDLRRRGVAIPHHPESSARAPSANFAWRGNLETGEPHHRRGDEVPNILRCTKGPPIQIHVQSQDPN